MKQITRITTHKFLLILDLITEKLIRMSKKDKVINSMCIQIGRKICKK